MGDTRICRECSHRIDLIFHQSDKRRNDNRHSIHQQSWQLIAQRLSATCRHQYKRIAAIKQVTNDCFLITLTRGTSEILFKFAVSKLNSLVGSGDSINRLILCNGKINHPAKLCRVIILCRYFIKNQGYPLFQAALPKLLCIWQSLLRCLLPEDV